MARNLRDAISQYDRYLRVEKNLSQRTRTAYAYDLARFADFLEKGRRGPASLDSVTGAQIKDYLNFLKSDLAYRAATLARNIASIRVFFDFCVEQEMLDASPAQAVHNPKQAKKLPVFLTDSELARLFGAPDRATPLGARDYAMLVTMAFCGVRLQELVGLDQLDVDFERRTIKVLGKGSKERLIPVNRTVEDALRAWLAVRGAKPGERAVFVNKRGGRITGRSVERIVDEYVVRAGLPRPEVSPHKLRHTFATLLHLRDVDLVEIQRLMGHATITSTQIYTHTNTTRLRSAVERLDDT
ncbi:MAG: tyrosine recombinase XerC [Candidatus Sumerlaeia bacterium]|nr:tyrosine recombinase XerC [Candidatus Sumerlaeia bacterium]